MVIGDILNDIVRRYPNKTAVLSQDGNATFAEVNARVNRLANALLNLGFKRGDKLAILSKNCLQYREVYLAAVKTGLVSVPINFRLQKSEIAYIIDNVEPALVVAQEEYLETVSSICAEQKSVRKTVCIGSTCSGSLNYEDLISTHTPDEPGVELSENDVFRIVYTSGTTGKPKGVVHTHKTCCAQFFREVNFLGNVPERVFLSVMPLSGQAGSSQDLFYFLGGASIVLLEHFDPGLVAQAVAKYRITDIYIVPTAINFLLNSPDFNKYDLNSLKTVLYSGSAMPVELLKKARAAMGNIFVQLYGSTEAWGVTVLTKEDHADINSRRLQSIGKPWLGVAVRIVDENDMEKSSGEIGEIIVKSDSVMGEYFGLAEATAAVLKDGWYHTGDLGFIDEDGYVYISGRKDEMINSGGLHVYPVEIENVIASHPAVAEVAVIGVPDPQWGQSVKAFVVAREGAKVTADELIELCKSKLASFKKPKTIEFVESLPKTSSGKIQRRALEDRRQEFV